MTTAREFTTLREEFHTWLTDTAPLVRVSLWEVNPEGPSTMPDAYAAVLPGAYDEEGEAGATVYAFDGVINDWAEWYSDLSAAFARLAAVVRCYEDPEGLTMFKDGAHGFVRWSTNFFNQSTTGEPRPLRS